MELGPSQIRELAMLALYEKQLNPQMELEQVYSYLLSNLKELKQNIQVEELSEEQFKTIEKYTVALSENANKFVPKSSFFKIAEVDEETVKEVPAYFTALIEGVERHQTEIDQLINKHIKGSWSVTRLESVNLQILRIAVYEMLYTDNKIVPNVVALSEALELAKLYSDDRSRKFINGVLSNILAEIEAKTDQE